MRDECDSELQTVKNLITLNMGFCNLLCYLCIKFISKIKYVAPHIANSSVLRMRTIWTSRLAAAVCYMPKILILIHVQTNIYV